MSDGLLTRVVQGPKSFWVSNPNYKKGSTEEGAQATHLEMKHGDAVQVTPQQAKAFSHMLVDPKVAKAQEAAAQAVAAAEEAEDAASNAAEDAAREAQRKAAASGAGAQPAAPKAPVAPKE